MTIGERIKAVYVLERFVRMSRNLLPNLTDLMSKEDQSKEDAEEIDEIVEVYESFQVNPTVSEILVNSNIFQLILEVYRRTMVSKGHNPEDFHYYSEFLKESDRLIDTWDRQKLN